MTTRYLTDDSGKSMKVIDVGGDYFVPVGWPDETSEQVKERFDYISQFKCRDDDVMLLSYPKTGTNWTNEVIGMLLNNSTEEPVVGKGKSMLEFQSQDNVDEIKSPRCINTHVNYRFIPKELKEKKIRTVLVLRNPKDMLVSYYNHIKGIRAYEYSGEWKDYFQLYLKGEMEYGMYWDYLKEFEKAIADGIGFPIYKLYYEDLKKNGLEEVQKLAKFLGVNSDEEFCRKVVDKCKFEVMSKKDIFPKEYLKEHCHEGFQFLRKGQIGDWMNWFTVAQNEQFDQIWNKEMADSKIKFTYA